MNVPPSLYFGHKSQFSRKALLSSWDEDGSAGPYSCLSSQNLVYFLLGFHSTSESEISQIITAAQQSTVLPQASSVCLLTSTSVDITREP